MTTLNQIDERLSRIEQAIMSLARGTQPIPQGQRGEFQRIASMSREERKLYDKMNRKLHKEGLR